MTPKEKARELLDRFIDKSVVIDDAIQYYHPKPYCLAKQCAIVAVEEILSVLRLDDKCSSNKALVYWWLLVKEEIEKL